MDIIAVVFIAIALAMDAFSVSVSAGICLVKPDFGHYFRLSFHFGLFQFIMPIIGYFLGATLESSIKEYDHWVAFGLLLIIGVKMLKEAFDEEDELDDRDPSRGLRLFVLAVATSIDALAVGLSIGVLNRPILLPSIIIGLVCAMFSVLGVFIGCRVRAIFSKRAEAVGGILLIVIGLKILYEHIVVG